MQVKKFINWITFWDYDLEKQKATARIVSRQSRGSVAAQNGWYMNLTRLKDLSRKADAEIAFLDKTIATPKV